MNVEKTKPVPVKGTNDEKFIPETRRRSESGILDLATDEDIQAVENEEPVQKPEPVSTQVETDKGEIMLEAAVAKVAPELWELVEKIILGPNILPDANPYQVTLSLANFMNAIQAEADALFGKIFNDLSKSALIALGQKDIMKKFMAKRNTAQGIPTSFSPDGAYYGNPASVPVNDDRTNLLSKVQRHDQVTDSEDPRG